MQGVYKNKAIYHLAKDKVMKRLIREYDILEEKYKNPNIFLDLVNAIVNQQLSGKAAATIFEKFKSVFKNKLSIEPDDILKISDDKLRLCGISFGKISYIKGLCKAVKSKTIDIENLYKKRDEEIIEELTKLKGIGRWTAEMILIFSLRREDVFSAGDLGLRNAVSKWYGVGVKDREKIEEISKCWSPYRSFASKILWRSLEKKNNLKISKNKK